MTTPPCPRNILYIPVEFSTWHAARSWSYSVQLALEEGFTACHANVVTLPAIRGLSAEMPTSWLRHASALLKNHSFDQVWIELVHNNPGERFLEWLRDIAPIRVALIGESLDYDDAAIRLHPHLAHRRAVVEGRLRHMTHALFADECDAERAEQTGPVRGLWWPQAVPGRCVKVPAELPATSSALFAGIAYGQREKWLLDPALDNLIKKVRSSEHATYLPSLFDTVQSSAFKQLEQGLVPEMEHLNLYVDMLRQVRRRCFDHWLGTLQEGSAVINLPSFVQAYAGRVVEGMAAGRPVISWKIPQRPRIENLFVSGSEILHYSAEQPAELAAQISFVIENPEAGRQIAEMARVKLSLQHTVEKRVQQIMEWLKYDIKPGYGDDNGTLGDIRVAEFSRTFGIEISLDNLTAKAQVNEHGSDVIDDVKIGAHIANKELDKAIDCLKPSDYYPEVKGMLAQLYIATGNDDAAADLIYQAVADEPGNAVYLLDAAELASKRGNRENAGFYLDEAGRLLLSELQRSRMEQIANGLDRRDEPSTKIPSFIEETMKAAKKLAQRGHVDEAIDKILTCGIKADPSSQSTYVELVEILLAAGRYDDALQVLPEMPLTTDRELMNEIEAICHAALGNDELARQATDRAGERPRALVVLGTLTARSGNLAHAEVFFRRAGNSAIPCGSAWLSLGMLLWGKGDQEEAYQAVRHAVVVDPLNSEAIRILWEMAERCSRQEDALQIVSEAVRRYPDCRNLARHYAEILFQCGMNQEALEECELFLVRFGVDEDLLSLVLQLKDRIGAYDRLAEAATYSISLCMIVKNEEKNLAACLASLKPVVDEMIVVDTGSTDRTVDIATVFGAKVSTFAWNGNFSDARNCALDEAKGKWILVMDADEVLSPLDYEAVRHAVREASGKKTAWSVLTRNYTTRVNAQGWTPNDRAYQSEERAGGWHPSRKVRLFPRERRIRFSGEVHEMVEHSLRQAGYKIMPVRFVVHHYGGLLDEKNREKMLNYFELGKKKLEERPDDIIALHELASQAGELAFYDEALLLWKRILDLNAPPKEALFNMSYAYIGLKRYHEGLLAARQVIEIDPDHREAAFNFGTCALYAGNLQEAVALLAPLSTRHPDYPPLLAIFTALNLATGSFDVALPAYLKLKEMNYSISDYIHERAETLDSLGRTEMAHQLRTGSATFGISR